MYVKPPARQHQRLLLVTAPSRLLPQQLDHNSTSVLDHQEALPPQHPVLVQEQVRTLSIQEEDLQLHQVEPVLDNVLKRQVW